MGVLAGIRDGFVTLAFRRWRRPTVKAGGTLRTALGVVAIDGVEPIDPSLIGEADALAAGYASRHDLSSELSAGEGEVYRIAVRWAGEDPRLALRASVALAPADVASIEDRLQRLDRKSPWTSQVLALIRDNEGVQAARLAERLDLPTPDFKRRVRQLKELGLTESLEVGYRLSPRGRSWLERPRG